MAARSCVPQVEDIIVGKLVFDTQVGLVNGLILEVLWNVEQQGASVEHRRIGDGRDGWTFLKVGMGSCCWTESLVHIGRIQNQWIVATKSFDRKESAEAATKRKLALVAEGIGKPYARSDIVVPCVNQSTPTATSSVEC